MRIFVGLLILISVVTFTAWYKIYESAHVREVREFRSLTSTIEIGTDKKDVIALLGEPHDRSKKFRLAQREGFEAAYQRAAKSGAVIYLVWFKGNDHVFSIGFDQLEKVVVIENGST